MMMLMMMMMMMTMMMKQTTRITYRRLKPKLSGTFRRQRLLVYIYRHHHILFAVKIMELQE